MADELALAVGRGLSMGCLSVLSDWLCEEGAKRTRRKVQYHTSYSTVTQARPGSVWEGTPEKHRSQKMSTILLRPPPAQL
jgi:hypothetical protein